MKHIKQFLRDEDGATAIEYGLIAALVAVAAVTALTGLGNQLDVAFTSIANTIGGAVN